MTEPTNDTYFTPKLGLTVHSMDDELDAQVPNWERLDTSFAGAIWVTPGTIPDNTILYDGALVAERETGKVWRAEKNVLGNFEQKWIKYPWMIMAVRTGSSFPTGVSDHEMGFSDVVQYMCVNSSAADLLETRIVVPIDAIYAIRIWCQWGGLGGYRSLKLYTELAVDTSNTESIVGSWPHFPYPQNYINLTRKLQKGWRVCAGLWHNSGTDNINYDLRMEVAVVTPL